MCHLILLLPIIALPVFWLMPAGEATVAYAAVLALSVGIYWFVLQAMRAPAVTGVEAMLHRIGTVRSVDGRKASVSVASELWSAETEPGALSVGDPVEVVGSAGLVLTVRKAGARGTAGASPSSAEPSASGARAEGDRCWRSPSAS